MGKNRCGKITKQAEVLKHYKLPSDDYYKLVKLSHQVSPGDLSNLEAQAARHYFSRIFGKKFNRNDMDWKENAALNYGYSVLLSTFNRSVVANGYLTQLGIHHIGTENAFNLSCDLMEPFRPIIGKNLLDNELWELNPLSKVAIVDVLNSQVKIEGNKQYLSNAISIYYKNVLDSLSDSNSSLFVGYDFLDPSKITRLSNDSRC